MFQCVDFFHFSCSSILSLVRNEGFVERNENNFDSQQFLWLRFECRSDFMLRTGKQEPFRILAETLFSASIWFYLITTMVSCRIILNWTLPKAECCCWVSIKTFIRHNNIRLGGGISNGCGFIYMIQRLFLRVIIVATKPHKPIAVHITNWTYPWFHSSFSNKIEIFNF